MRIPFQTCLLIDDNSFDNFTNTLLIQKTNFVNEVIAIESSNEAMLALKAGTVKPNVIFLDINMPVMNGFEFLEEYSKTATVNVNTKIFVLSSSINPVDRINATKYSFVTKYIEKPLTEDELEEIMV